MSILAPWAAITSKAPEDGIGTPLAVCETCLQRRSCSTGCATRFVRVITAVGPRTRTCTGSGRDDETGGPTYISPLVRDSPSRGRLRHPDGAGAAGACRCDDDDDLHARAQSRSAGGAESGRPVVTDATGGSQARPARNQAGHRSFSSPAIRTPATVTADACADRVSE
jgi:hypothetical protein